MRIKINPDNVVWAMYCPAWTNVNGDDAPVMEFRLKTGRTLKISVSADTVKAAVKIYPTVCCELTQAQVKAALSNIDKEGN